jgi:hypothetical protein
MNAEKQPRKLPQSTPPAEDDPSMIVLEALDAIATALDLQATISAAQFLLNNAPEDEMPTLRQSDAIQNAKASALAYLRDAGQNGDTPQ